MPLELQNDCVFSGPALPLPFVKLGLEAELNRLRLLPRSTGDDAAQLETFWKTYRAHLRQLVSQGGPQRVRNQVIEPLLDCPFLGYSALETAGDVRTREGLEDGGGFLVAPDGARLRFWTVALEEDLDAPARRGEAYRFSHARIASRVLLASGERLGLLTNGSDLRLLVCDPARLDSHMSISLDGAWKRSREVPDSFRLFIALTRPEGVRALPELVEKARLQQVKVTKDLRVQARLAVEEFLQAVLDFPGNAAGLAEHTDRAALARALWHEGLVTVYRLLFVFKLESTDDPAKCFSFASGSLWRNSVSPGVALAPFARALLDRGEQTGQLLEDGLRTLFRMLEGGLQCTELNIKPMGGSLFAPNATPILSALRWPEHGVASLLDHLLWTTPRRGSTSRERVHYGPLDVEDLGRVYEALLELEPGISSEPMCRLRRAKLEVVVPAAQGERYRPSTAAAKTAETVDGDEPEDEPEEEETGGKKTKVEWIEAIPPGRFHLRVGLGRKSTGSFYTPHSFVRFLVQETLGPLVERVSPRDDPRPAALLALKVVDKAMGSGHFLVEVARFLGDALHEACRRCDDLARAADQRAQTLRAEGNAADADAEAARASEYLRRVEALPDPDDELLRYLPSRSVEGVESGFSLQKATGLCRRMVAVHCLYGVDKNPLAVELAKLALWIECHAEGLPLTFLDHRLVVGDSLTGPFFEHILTYPGTQQPLDGLFSKGLAGRLAEALTDALRQVRDLEATVGATVADLEAKRAAKARLDRDLAPFRLLAAAWSGGVMLGGKKCDDLAYGRLAQSIAETGDLPDVLGDDAAALRAMIATGLGLPDFPACSGKDALLAQLDAPACIPALAYDLVFPEVFYPTGDLTARHGFDADLGNPPWDAVRPKAKEFFASFDFDILNAPTKRERAALEKQLLSDPVVAEVYREYLADIDAQHAAHERLYKFQVVEVAGEKTGGDPDLAKLFLERSAQILKHGGRTGVVVPSAFHANEGATGVRRLYLNHMALGCCFSFENRRKLFEIDSRFKFAVVVAEKGGTTSEFSCAFYLHDDEWLFKPTEDRKPLRFSLDFVRRTGGEYLSLLETRSQADLDVAEVCFSSGEPFGQVCERLGIELGRELHMTDDAWRFTPTNELLSVGYDSRDPTHLRDLVVRGYLVLHEGKTFHQYDDIWGSSPKYAIGCDRLQGKDNLVANARFFRVAYRAIARTTDQRTMIFAVLPPGVILGNSAPALRNPHEAPAYFNLSLGALANSFVFDWTFRQKGSANANQFILFSCPIPRLDSVQAFLAHSALRLTCNHAGYAPLWQEQVGDEWREPTPRHTWPVLDGDDARWAVRAAIDAVVAQAYGLTREQYEHVLSTFSHSSYKGAPALCLAAFDELQRDGLEAFTRRHDPYWDIPLNEALPKPVIDLPIPAELAVHEGASAYHVPELFPDLTPTTPRRKRRA